MKLVKEQLKGPFYRNESITVTNNYDYQYVHIGIQIPNRQPVSYYNHILQPPDIVIDGEQYIVNESNILEFDDFRKSGMVISFLKDLPAETIIDIVYKDQEF